MIYGIYRLLTRLAFWIAFPLFIAYSLVTGRHRKSLRQRMGFFDKSQFIKNHVPVIWFHAASVGEVKAAGILIRTLSEDFPDVKIVLTTVTEQGHNVALGEIGRRATCLYAPLDFPSTVARAVSNIEPAIYICLETELWPNLIHEMRKRGIKMFLLNARISERSSHRYKVLGSLVSEILLSFAGIAAISDSDANRLLKLGAQKDKLFVTGNVKYDSDDLSDPQEIRAHYNKILGLNSRNKVLIAGSTHTGEEEIVLRAFSGLQKVIEGLVLIVAPRHLPRLPDIIQKMKDKQVEFNLLSDIRERNRTSNIVLIDTMGELSRIYSVADFIFCGGSLVDRGGHNLLEAAKWKVPVLYGPFMKDFEDARTILEENGGGLMVKSEDELTSKIGELAMNRELYNRYAKGAEKSATLQHNASKKQMAPVIETLRKITC